MAQSPPPTLVYRVVKHDDFEALRVLNSSIFPVSYKESFYTALRMCPELVRGAFVHGELVGALCARLHRAPGHPLMLYIASLGVLAPYRSQGIGSRLLDQGLSIASRIHSVGLALLHVQTSNAEAIRFYEERGFARGEVLPNYYRRLDCNEAVIMRKQLGPPL